MARLAAAQAEKERLLAEGFGEWSRAHYQTFLKSSAKYGRAAYGRIAGEVGFDVERVQRLGRAATHHRHQRRPNHHLHQHHHNCHHRQSHYATRATTATSHYRHDTTAAASIQLRPPIGDSHPFFG